MTMINALKWTIAYIDHIPIYICRYKWSEVVNPGEHLQIEFRLDEDSMYKDIHHIGHVAIDQCFHLVMDTDCEKHQKTGCIVWTHDNICIYLIIFNAHECFFLIYKYSLIAAIIFAYCCFIA